MKKIILTCPFTGVEFEALEYADGSILIKHPITGERVKINWNGTINRFNVPKTLFKHYATVTMSEAAEILGVSRQRITAIAKDEVIPPKTVNGSVMFLASDVLEYKNTRKVGAPSKRAVKR